MREVPGETPRLPLSTEGPVLVMLVPPSTTKGLTVARLTGAAWTAAGTAAKAKAAARIVPASPRLKRVGVDVDVLLNGEQPIRGCGAANLLPDELPGSR